MDTTPRDPHPDSQPGDNHDNRSDIEQVVESRSDDVERLGTQVGTTSPLDPAGEYSGVSGDGGVVKDQDLTQQ